MSRRQRQQSNEAAQQSPNKNFSRGRNRTAQQTNNVVDINNYRRPVKNKVLLLPKNIAQENYIEQLEDDNIDICFATGYAGTGKTYLSVLYGIRCLKEGIVDRVIISRPNVGIDSSDIGFLPGNIMQKMAPWTRPIFDVFEEYYSVKEITAMVEENIIEVVALQHVRGRTFKNAIVIIDEAQNTTPNAMLSILTRIGEGSKLLITGDLAQTDIGQSNGLSDFIDRFTGSKRISISQFGKDAIERHPVITEILKMYGKDY